MRWFLLFHLCWSLIWVILITKLKDKKRHGFLTLLALGFLPEVVAIAFIVKAYYNSKKNPL